MNIVRDILHTVREFFGIGNDLVVLVSLAQAPAVVNDYIFITAVLESAFDDEVGGFHNNLFIYVFSKCVP